MLTYPQIHKFAVAMEQWLEVATNTSMYIYMYINMYVHILCVEIFQLTTEVDEEVLHFLFAPLHAHFIQYLL